MIRRIKKTRKYHAPSAKVTHLVQESNFCTTFNLQVDQLRNINTEVEEVEDGEPMYFEF